MRKIFVLLLLVFLFQTGFARKPLYRRHQIVNKVLSEILKAKDFQPAEFGFFAVDTHNGEIVASYQPDKALRPASNQKLFSTATALELYGPDYRFQTYLGYTGYIDTLHHVLHGDIIIKGGGDPTLGSKYFDQTKTHAFLDKWVNAVKKIGIDSITGSVIADARIFSRDIVPLSWSWNNMGDYYGAGACGLTVFDNFYRIYFDTDSIPGHIVSIDSVVPKVPMLIFDNGIVSDTVRGDRSDILGAPYCNQRYLRGRLPLGRHGFPVKGSLPDPAYMAAYSLRQKLINTGINVGKEASTVRRLMLSHNRFSDSLIMLDTIFSPPLSEIIQQTNTHSINLFAEHLLDLSGLKLIGEAQTEKDAKALMQFWKGKGMNIQGMALTDGSGLSQYNAVTTRQVVFLLNYMKNNSVYYNIFYHSLPLAGESDQAGTLEGMFVGTVAEGNLRAKSGTIDRVKAYSGYVTSRSGREIAFSMIVNNFSGKSKEAKDKLMQLMLALAELKK